MQKAAPLSSLVNSLKWNPNNSHHLVILVVHIYNNNNDTIPISLDIYIYVLYIEVICITTIKAQYQLFVLLCGQNPENLERLLKISSS